MSKNTKIALGVIIGVVVVCLCVCVGGYFALQQTGKILEENMILDDPQEARALAQSMLDYQLPPGYQEGGAVNMGIMKMVMIDDPANSGRPMIMLAEMPSGGAYNEEDMQRQIEESLQRSMGNRNFNLRLMDEQTRTIRGQEVVVLIFEGTDSNGAQAKQMVTEIFDGKNGSMMVMVVGSEVGWNQAELDAFFDSMR